MISKMKQKGKSFEIKLNQRVKEIAFYDKKPIIKCENNEHFECDLAVITVSLGVLQSKQL